MIDGLSVIQIGKCRVIQDDLGLLLRLDLLTRNESFVAGDLVILISEHSSTRTFVHEIMNLWHIYHALFEAAIRD
jgi:hypothetical protein